MPHRPGTHRLLLAASGFCLALTVADPATAQILVDEHPDHAPCATEPQPGDGSWCYPKGPEIHVIVREPLAEAIGMIGSDELRYQDALRSGKQPQPERTHYPKLLELSDAQDDLVRAIMLDAISRLRDLWPEIDKEGLELQHHYSDDLADKRFALIAQLQPIYDGVARKLRDDVGEDAVRRIEKYFDRKDLNTTTSVYFYRRPRKSVYLGEVPNPVEAPVAVKHE